MGGRAGERDRRERRGRDRADSGGEAVDPVEEVDHVHQRDDAEHGEPVGHGGAQRERADERDGQVLDAHTRRHRHDCCEQLADELEVGRELEDVVGRSDDRDHRGADQDPVRLARVRHEHPAGGDERGEDGQAAEPRRGELVEAAGARAIDRADPPGERGSHRRGEEADDERQSKGEEAVGQSWHCVVLVEAGVDAARALVMPARRRAERAFTLAALVVPVRVPFRRAA